MASQMFSASQVCQIVSGEDGDLDYVFPGSDDDLGKEETDEEDLENEVDSSEMHSNLFLLAPSGSTSGDEGSSGGGSGSGGGGSSGGGVGVVVVQGLVRQPIELQGRTVGQTKVVVSLCIPSLWMWDLPSN